MKDLFKGRGTESESKNRFLRQWYATEWPEGLDEPVHTTAPQTETFYDSAKNIVNKVNSPDVGLVYSANPYQGCEHGCVYCYARPTHEYWGWNSGLDFERKIIVKKDAPKLLEQFINRPAWQPQPIMLSGNTDCYQPMEKKLRLTRKMLEVCARYRHPVGIITKNTLLLRDIDLLQDLSRDNLVQVFFSITTMDEKLRSVLEPRTATTRKKLKAIEKLTVHDIPAGIMNAPIIPGLNHHESPAIIKAAAEAGALTAGYTVLRLNGDNAEMFRNWLLKYYPDRLTKVWNQVSALHGGKPADSRFGLRMSGEGNFAAVIKSLFNHSKNMHMKGRAMPAYNLHAFRAQGNYTLF